MSEAKVTAAEIQMMLQLVKLEAQEHATMHGESAEPVADSPAATYGNHGFAVLTVERMELHAPALQRLWFSVGEDCPVPAWQGANMAVRLEIPVQPEEFQGVEGAPVTASRAYTIAQVDEQAQLVAIDFVLHGDSSPVMQWLSGVSVGDRLHVWMPKQHRVPGTCRHLLLVADSTALPAALSILREGVSGTAVLVTDADPAELKHDYPFLGEVDVRLVPDLVSTVVVEEWPGVDWLWACGESNQMKQIRSFARTQLGLDKARTQVYGYWKQSASFTSIDVGRMRRLAAAIEQGLDMDVIEQEMEEDL